MQLAPHALRTRLQCGVTHALQPRLLPEEQTAGLTSAVRLAVAPEPVQVNSVGHTAGIVIFDRIAGFMGRFEYLEAFPTVLQHFRHERKRIETSSLVEGGKDLSGAPHLHPIARTKTQHKAYCGF